MRPRTVTSAAVAAAIFAIAGPALAADPDLVVFDWAGYEDPSFHQAYIEKYGDSPTFAYFGDEEEAFQKLRTGFKADLGHPCSQSVVKWREAGLIEPLDTSRILNWDKLMPAFRNMEGFVHDGKQYVMPVDWGGTFLTYRADLVDAADILSLQAFADPKFQGRVSIGDNVDDAYALGFLAVGVTDWTKATDEQFQAASEFLRKVHPNVRAYWQDGASLAQLMASGEVVLAWAWNETAVTMQGEGHPVELTRDTDEGYSTWVCGYVNLVNGAGSEDKMYDFLSAWNEDRVAQYIVSEWGYGHSNSEGMQLAGAEALASMGYDNMEAYVDKTLWQAPLPSDLREKMIAEFEKIKAGF